jgi:hypothetical protein
MGVHRAGQNAKTVTGIRLWALTGRLKATGDGSNAMFASTTDVAMSIVLSWPEFSELRLYGDHAAGLIAYIN